MFHQLQEFWSKGVAQKVIVVAVAGALAMLSCGGLAAVVGAAIETSGTSVNQSPTNTIQQTPTPKPTHAASATATHAVGSGGQPRLGSPESVFIAAYGPPFGHGTGNSDEFYTDSTHTVIVGASVTNGIVTHIDVAGDPSWSDQQTYAMCARFLPTDATAYNSVGPNTDYHSSLGNVVLANYDGGACVLFLTQ
jgi:hypothetical protein